VKGNCNVCQKIQSCPSAFATVTLLAGAFLTFAAAATKPDDATVKEAYVYLLSHALVIRQESNDLKVKVTSCNHIKFSPLGSADIVNPNFDVAYLEAWFAGADRINHPVGNCTNI